jgi:nucleotide-binding universal stress UspA family protein
MKYLVPFDFTKITESALNHALCLSKVTKAEIELLHVVSSETKSDKAMADLEAVKASLDSDTHAKVSCVVRVGDIFEDISSQATESEADLMVMGTHGAKGFQKLRGSHALRVITSSEVPFIITQEKGPSDAIDRIVVPVDLTKESIQVIDFAGELAKTFGAEIRLVFSPEKDEWLAKKLKVNTGAARIRLSKFDVKFEVDELPGKDSLQKEVIEYGAKHRADMFAIAHFSDSILPQFDSFSQDMITNKFEIPVLIVTAQMVKDIQANYAFMTI